MEADARENDTIIIRYEDLVLNPGHFLEVICEELQLERFTPGEGVKDHNTKYLERWQRDHQAEARMFLSYFPDATAFMKRFGYSLFPPYIDYEGFAQALRKNLPPAH